MTTEELSTYFRENCRPEGNLIRLSGPMLGRSDYMQVKKILEGRGGKWKGGKTSAFVFDSDAGDIYSSLCGGEVENRKTSLQFFPTPDSVADMMAGMLHLRPDDKVLEPSAGRGSLIKAVRRVCGDVRVDAWEINPDCIPSLERIPGVNVTCGDFLSAPEDAVYDAVIANPPFSKNQDVRHFMKMLSVLKPGGRLCCIMSPNAFTSREKIAVEFRKTLKELDAKTQELECGTFRESGTNINTYLITIIK